MVDLVEYGPLTGLSYFKSRGSRPKVVYLPNNGSTNATYTRGGECALHSDVIRRPARYRSGKEWRNASSSGSVIDVLANADAKAELQSGAGRVELVRSDYKEWKLEKDQRVVERRRNCRSERSQYRSG